ncbi:hypothetical protein NAL32_11300 [Chryseobacterium sp. Ch-15]|uniref:GNAT family N-acetyltransferase n=1 Tax=Chryseobacterium muglaense TaxID=2893752 RepID=A0A9Q3UU02_9FLAO|nr:hypothetical protein [Chryseobacterium muglaense]MBD3905108.1 hypothetical protein [Chryseobacterium muglaense]MCC9033451.1 hypothetical protein [Chryseobacterium muglaense]MCM2554970.1 hypothetical protein [Chryseobacterium muglaense]
MIKRLKYHEIDFEKYTQCLENSAQRKYSATKQFLDISSDKKWELLVYNDYEAVMPIPYVFKSGVKIIHNPMLCQQLGVFSKEDNVEINEQFLSFLEKNYLIRIYTFNEFNHFKTSLKSKKNYLILPNDYNTVYSKYSPKRKRKLRLDEEVIKNSEIKNISFSQAESFIKENFLGADKDEDVDSFINIFKNMYEANCLNFSAFYLNHKIINIIVTYFDDFTVSLLGTFNDKESVKVSGASTLIDNCIKENISTKIFDFEGSELPNVEEFFRGFRPELRPYHLIEYSKKEIIKKLLNLKFIMKL